MKKIIRIVLLIAIVIIAIKAYPYVKLYLSAQKSTENIETEVVFVKTGTNLHELVNLLVEKKLLKDTVAFIEVSRYKHLDSTNIAAGKYEIEPNTSIKNLANGFFINRLGNGNGEKAIQLVFNNCRDVYDLAGSVAQFIEADSSALIKTLTNPALIAHYGFNENTFISLFMPDTYQMYWDCSPKKFVERMAKEYKKFWNPSRKAKAKKQGLSQSEASTLASIVYKEQSVVKEEWPAIAGLYLNRLHDNWKLESDPTFRYCWGNELEGVQRLTYKHRDIECPYNTYKVLGLPPGPICTPPKGVVNAVLNPDNNDYYFMCAKPGGIGKHNFAHSYAQHLRNARKYQSWLNEQGIR